MEAGQIAFLNAHTADLQVLIDMLWQEPAPKVEAEATDRSQAFQLRMYRQFRKFLAKDVPYRVTVDADGQLVYTDLANDPDAGQHLWTIYRGLVNTRQPGPLSDYFVAKQDAFLAGLRDAGMVYTLADARQSPMYPQLYMWQGDITQLAVDAIVNAANKELLGCFVPNHACIDNAIHTMSGSQMRNDMEAVIADQGRKEAIGKAKISPAYNLPSRYVMHTVGPVILKTPVSDMNRGLLAQCYAAILDLAYANELASVAMCSISTGEFHFPKDLACQIAVETCQSWLADHPQASDMKIIFNVFADEDAALYEKALGL